MKTYPRYTAELLPSTNFRSTRASSCSRILVDRDLVRNIHTFEKNNELSAQKLNEQTLSMNEVLDETSKRFQNYLHIFIQAYSITNLTDKPKGVYALT